MIFWPLLGGAFIMPWPKVEITLTVDFCPIWVYNYIRQGGKALGHIDNLIGRWKHDRGRKAES